MAKSGMYYHGKHLLECELEKLTPEQKDICLLETQSRILHESSLEFTAKCARINQEYTEKPLPGMA